VNGPDFGWSGIVRLGLVQTALGAIIVLTTSTINRVMVVELALPAMLPGILVALHHIVQLSRPHFGYGSDVGRRRTPWIIGGMLVLAAGGILASIATALMSHSTAQGTALAVLAFVLIGFGVGSAGTSLLTLMAKRVEQRRKAAAATIVWIMMIAGFAITAGLAGHFLEPYSPGRLILVTTVVAGCALLVTVVSLYGLEGRSPGQEPAGHAQAQSLSAEAASMPRFREALAEVWQETEARRFTLFVFVSMLAYSAQDLILEPYAGMVFGMTPGESTQLSGVQHGGVLVGMLLVAVTGSLGRSAREAVLRRWVVGGCVASGVALAGIAYGGFRPDSWPLASNVFCLGVANGAFAVAAIASMMMLASHGQAHREGLRMGLWGAAQAIAFGLGGFVGTVAFDLARYVLEQPAIAYSLVFSLEACVFLVAAWLGLTALRSDPARAPRELPSFGEIAMVNVMDRSA
jgi:BCD family chlorophyll transporter-like MFS transporter